MEKKLKRIFVLFLCLLMIFQTPIVSVFADDTNPPTNTSSDPTDTPNSDPPTDPPTDPPSPPALTTYEVTFKYGDATYNAYPDDDGQTTIEVEENTEITLPVGSDFTYDGYRFEGWYVEGNTTTLGSTFTITDNITFVCDWHEIGYVVTLHLNGASYQGHTGEWDVEIEKGASFDIPTKNNLNYDGMRFYGWYSTSTFTGEPETGTITPTGDVNLYAKWETQQYVVLTFFPNDDSGIESYNSGSLACGSEEIFPSVERAGYRLVGWYKNVDFDNDFNNTGVDTTNYGTSNFIVPEMSTNYYAKWEEDPNADIIKVNFSVSDTALESQVMWKTDANKKYVFFNSGTNYSTKLPTPSCNGYQFVGWYLDSGYTQELQASDCTVSRTIYAKFEISQVGVVLSIPSDVKIVQGGTIVSKNTYTVNVNDGDIVNLPIAYKTNCEFKGWKNTSTNEIYYNSYIANMNEGSTLEPVFEFGGTTGFLHCIQGRSCHYANIKDNNSRCPYCGHTTYEILYCVTLIPNWSSISSEGLHPVHTWTHVKWDEPCSTDPQGAFYPCRWKLGDAACGLFPEGAVSFDYVCTGDYSHHWTTNENGENVCSICNMKYSTWYAEYLKENPITATSMDNPQYAGQYSALSGSDKVKVTIYNRKWGDCPLTFVGGPHTSACWWCSFDFYGPNGVHTAWWLKCLDCGMECHSAIVYNTGSSKIRSDNYSEYYCPSCGNILQGAGFGTHTCEKWITKQYTANFYANNGYPKNSRNESPSTATGSDTRMSPYWSNDITVPSISSWVGYTTDKWMYNTNTIQHNITRYLNPGQRIRNLAEHNQTVNFYARHIPNKYTINFYFNKPETSSSVIKLGDKVLGSTVASTSAKVTFDDYLTNAVNTTDSTMDGKYLSIPTMEGWVFKGWCANANGQGTLVTSELRLTKATMESVFGSVPANGSTLTLYAIWEPTTTTFTFHSNNTARDNEYGTATIVGTMPQSTDNYDSCGTNMTNLYTRSYTTYYNKQVNYIFAGWMMGQSSATAPTAANDTTTLILPNVPKGATPTTNKVAYQDVTNTSVSSFNSFMNGEIVLGNSTTGIYVKNRLIPLYGEIDSYARTYDGTNIPNARWDYGFVVARARQNNKGIRFNYNYNVPNVAFYDGDNNLYRNLNNGAYVSFATNSAYSNFVATSNSNGKRYVDLYAAWIAYNTRPQAFFRLAVKEYNVDGTFTGRLVDYKDDSFYGNKTSGTPLYNDSNTTSTVVYDDACVYLHAAYFDPETMNKGGDEYQFSVDGGNTWFLLQPGIDNKYLKVVATTYTNEDIKSDTQSTTAGFTSNEISGPITGYVYKIYFKTATGGNDQTIQIRYRAKDSVRYTSYYANASDYDNGIVSEAQKVLWSTGYYESEATKYQEVTFEGQTLKKYNGDIATAGTLTKKTGEVSNNSNENGSWATKTIVVKSGNTLPIVGLNGSNQEKSYYSSLTTAMPMYDYATGISNGTELYDYTKGNIYLLVSKEEENLVSADTTLTGTTFRDKVIEARGLTRYKDHIYLIRESEQDTFISTNGTLSYNSQTLGSDNSGTLGNVSGSQYTKYVPGDETIGFLDTTLDSDNKGYGLYFISIIDKDTKMDILTKSGDSTASQLESKTGAANLVGMEQYAGVKTIVNGSKYTYKNETYKTADSIVGITGHIFTSYKEMVKFIYNRVGAEFPEISDLYNGQYVIFYAVCDKTWNNMSPQKWTSVCVESFETQPRLSILNSYISNIEAPNIDIDEPLTIWLKDDKKSPRYKINDYSVPYTFDGINTYRSTKLLATTANKSSTIQTMSTEANTNYVKISNSDAKLPFLYKIHCGYQIDFNVEVIGADYVEMSLAQKNTNAPLPIVIEYDSIPQYDKKYEGDVDKQEKYLITYSTRSKDNLLFSYSNTTQEDPNTTYGYKIIATKKLITKPDQLLQREVILGNDTFDNNSSIIYIISSVYNDVGIDLVN